MAMCTACLARLGAISWARRPGPIAEGQGEDMTMVPVPVPQPIAAVLEDVASGHRHTPHAWPVRVDLSRCRVARHRSPRAARGMGSRGRPASAGSRTRLQRPAGPSDHDLGVSNDHVSAKGEKASRRAPWLVTGGHDELVNTTETGQRVRQHRRVR